MNVQTVNPMALATIKGVSIEDFAQYVQSRVKTRDAMESRFFALAIEYAKDRDCEVDIETITSTVTFK